MKFLSLILASCLFFSSVQAQAKNFLFDATSFDPQPVMVAAANNSVPTGTVMIWTQEIIPEGWLECNGQPVKPEYELYKTMKKTPNYQGMFLRGAGSQTINHGSYGSVTHKTQLGVVQSDTIRNIEGEYSAVASRNSFQEVNVHYYGAFKPIFSFGEGVFGESNKKRMSGLNFDASRVVPTSEENRPVNIGVKYIIKCD